MKKIRIISCNHCPQSYFANSLNIRVCNDPETVNIHQNIRHRQCPDYDIRDDCPLEGY